MDKRSVARKKRIDEILEKKDIVDLSKATRWLRSVERKVNLVYRLNVRYAFAKMDADCLLRNGWQKTSAMGGRKKTTVLHMPGVCGGHGANLTLSSENEWLSLYCGDRFEECVWDEKLTVEEAQVLESTTSSAVKAIPPQSLAEEIQACQRRCPPLFTVAGKPIDVMKENFGSLWRRIFKHHCDKGETNLAIAHVFSLLRHREEGGSALRWMAMDLVTAGEVFRVDAWKACACLLLLEKEPDGCICTHYYALVSALLNWDLYEAALYCSYVCWLYTQTEFVLHLSELALTMRLALGELVRKRKFDGVERILSVVPHIEEKTTSREIPLDAMYLRALLSVRDGKHGEARKWLCDAEKVLRGLEKDEMSEREMELQAAVTTCRKLVGQLKTRAGGRLARHFLKKCLEDYPEMPGRLFWEGTTLPEAFSYPGHGAHWEVVFGHEDVEEKVMQVTDLLKARPPVTDCFLRESPGKEQCEYWLSHYEDEGNGPLEVDAVVGIVSDNGNQPCSRMVSFFPARHRAETEGLMSATPCGLAFDDDYQEFLLSIAHPHGQIELFCMPNDFDYALVEGMEYPLQLTAWGYFLDKLKPFEIKMKVTGGGKRKSTMEKLIVNEDLRNLTNAPGGYRDDIHFVARIADIGRLTFLGNPMFRFLLEFDERAFNLKLPLFIRVDSVAEGYKPEVGDVVEGTAWLQGRLCDEEGMD